MSASKRRIRAAVAVGAVLALAVWSALWFAAAHSVDKGLNEWMSKEAAAGRVWSCSHEAIEGFPLRIRLSCRAPSFNGLLAGQSASIAATEATLWSEAWSPNRINLAIGGSLRASAPALFESARLTWTRLAGTARFSPAKLLAVSMAASGLVAKLAPGGKLAARDLRIEARLHPGRDGQIDLTLATHDATGAPLTHLLGSSVPIDLEAHAKASGAAALVEAPSIAAIEAWRRTGGKIVVRRGFFSQGRARIHFAGVLRLDADHRLAGRLTVKATRIARLLAHFGASAAVVDADSLLDGLFGGGSSAALNIPVVFAGGRVRVGPFVAPIRLTPLY